MKFIALEPEVNLYKEGFEENDILQRAAVGKELSALVERIEDPLVIALEGHWGAGKTYFLKRWVGAHRLQNQGQAKTVYFDAFAHDYLSDPLPALVDALSVRFPESDKQSAVKMIKDVAFKLVKPVARVGLAIATHGAAEALKGFGAVAAEATGDEAAKEIENYWQQEDGRRTAMEGFKSELEKLVGPPAGAEGKATGARLVIVVDELDRCRPDYALEVLEVIKHFFSVPGVSFILGVNLSALENMVKARYGQDIDAAAYLHKFIHVSLALPSVIKKDSNSSKAVSVYLKHYLRLQDIPPHIAKILERHLDIVTRRNKVSIRDIGKILNAIPLLSKDILTPGRAHVGWIEVVITLIVSQIIRPDLYPKFLNATVKEDELVNYFDAMPLRPSEEMSGNPISFYHHPNRYLFALWMFLVQGGALPNEREDMVQHFYECFIGYGRPENSREVPGIAHRNHIDLFTLTRG